MSVHQVNASEGWAGLVAAANRALEGDEIAIGAGQFSGSQCLYLDKSVKLSGVEGTELNFEGRGSVIRIRNAVGFELSNLHIRYTAAKALTIKPKGEDYSFSFSSGDATGLSSHFGLGIVGRDPDAAIYVEYCDQVSVTGCVIECAGRKGHAMRIEHSDEASVEGCTVEGFDVGIMFWGSRGRISGSRTIKTRIGIELHDAHSNPRFTTFAIVENNHCSQNDVGINLLSSLSERIADNLCENCVVGICLQRCTLSKELPATANIRQNTVRDCRTSGVLLIGADDCEITDNTIEQCKEAGILALANTNWESRGSNLVAKGNSCNQNQVGIWIASTDALVEDNDCYDNKRFGIALDGANGKLIGNTCSGNRLSGMIVRPREGTGCPSEADIIDNVMEKNIEDGIVVAGTHAGTISGNRCIANNYSGIVLQAISSEQLCSADLIEANVCLNNGRSGIILLSSTARVERNTCSDNEFHGIVCTRNADTPEYPSSASVIANVCNDNKKTGIVMLGSLSDRIEENECCRNSNNGLAIEGDETSASMSEVASLARNLVRSNRSSGITLAYSSVHSITNNISNQNGNSGILLTILTWSKVGSHCEQIDGNECHENNDSGILLFSSQAGLIDNNSACWNKLQGICLDNVRNALDIRSSAIIKSNRCGNNQKSGIVLLTSDSESIDGNECWANSMNGICLEAKDDQPNGGSTAAITNNRVHHNASGIQLIGSRASVIGKNAVWGHKFQGIALLPFMPSRVPSEARMVSNVLSHGANCAILIRNSTSMGIEENWFIENNGDFIFDEYGGDEIIRVNSHGPIEGNVNSVKDRHDRKSMIGSLIAKGYNNKQAIAMDGFIENPDCAHCFADAVVPDGFQRAKERTEYISTDPKSNGRHLQISISKGDHVVADAAGDQSRPIAAIGTIVRRLQVRAGAGQVVDPVWVVLVSADEGDVRQVSDIVQHAGAEASRSGGASLSAAHPSIHVDYSPRNASEDITPSAGLFEAEMVSQSITRERIQCLVRLPEIWLLLAAFATAIGLAWYAGFLTPVELQSRIARWTTFSNVTWTAGLVIVGYAVLIAYLNVRLPNLLRFRQSLLMWVAWTWNIAVSVVPHDLITRLYERFGTALRERVIQPIEDRVWLEWVQRKLRARGDGVHTLVFSNVEAWQGADLRRLQRLNAIRDGNYPICFIVQLDSRASIFPLFLQRQKEAGWPARFDLLLNDFDDELHIKHKDIELGEVDIAEEINSGLIKHFGARNDAEAAELRGSFTDEEWWPIDLLPSLSIGSAPAGKFTIRRKIMLDISAKLHDEIKDFGLVFEPDTTQRVWTDQHVVNLFKYAERAPSIRVYQTADKRERYERIAGRVGQRRAVARLLSILWNDEQETRQYLASAIRCSILANQQVVLETLHNLTNYHSADIASRALDAVIFLAEDLQSLDLLGSASFSRVTPISENWHEIMAIFDRTVDIGDSSAAVLDLYPAVVCAWWKLEPGQCDTRIKEDLAFIESQLADHPGEDVPATLRHRALAKLSRQMKFLSFMETELATDTIARLREMEWRRLPDPIASKANTMVEKVFAHRRTLDQLIHTASDEKLLELYASLHRRTPMKVLYHLAVSAVRSSSKWTRDQQLIELPMIASHTLATARSIRLAQSAKLSVADLELEVKRMAGGRNVEGNGTAAAFMLNLRSEERLFRQLRPDIDPSPAIPFVFDRELDRLLLVSEEILRWDSVRLNAPG